MRLRRLRRSLRRQGRRRWFGCRCHYCRSRHQSVSRSPPVYLRGVRSAGAAHALPLVRPRAFVDGFKSQRLGLCGMPLSRCHACAADARKLFFCTPTGPHGLPRKSLGMPLDGGLVKGKPSAHAFLRGDDLVGGRRGWDRFERGPCGGDPCDGNDAVNGGATAATCHCCCSCSSLAAHKPWLGLSRISSSSCSCIAMRRRSTV